MIDLSKYQKLNTTIDGYQEYRKDRWKYVLFPCIKCGTDTLKRKDVYSIQQKCRSCAAKERMESADVRQKLASANTTHGQSNSLTWRSWFQMRRRVREGSKHHSTYEGMYIDPRWDSFELFFEDMGERRSSKYTIDRIDNAKGYFKDNCRWATASQQSKNRSSNRRLTHNGKTMCLMDWSRETGLSKSCIESRLKRDWSIPDALTLPHGSKIKDQA